MATSNGNYQNLDEFLRSEVFARGGHIELDYYLVQISIRF